jgi:hypothetical protein
MPRHFKFLYACNTDKNLVIGFIFYTFKKSLPSEFRLHSFNERTQASVSCNYWLRRFDFLPKYSAPHSAVVLLFIIIIRHIYFIRVPNSQIVIFSGAVNFSGALLSHSKFILSLLVPAQSRPARTRSH